MFRQRQIIALYKNVFVGVIMPDGNVVTQQKIWTAYILEEHNIRPENALAISQLLSY